ncbi:hypothetical protein COOONC_07137, partial [Cooperia oncophora]
PPLPVLVETAKSSKEIHPAPESVAPFRVAGLPNSVQQAKVLQPINEEDVDEKDKVWVSIMQQAVARCGLQQDTFLANVRAVVEVLVETAKSSKEIHPAPESVAPFRVAGLPNSVQQAKVLQPINEEDVDEKDKVWVSIMQQAVARCGLQQDTFLANVRAVVEGNFTPLSTTQ